MSRSKWTAEFVTFKLVENLARLILTQMTKYPNRDIVREFRAHSRIGKGRRPV